MNRIIMTWLFALLPGLVLANEFTFPADVLSSEEITISKTTDTMADECHARRPTTFGQLLSWDVGCEQPRTIETIAYRITYTFDGKQFSVIQETPPGSTIPIRIRLNSQRSGLLAHGSDITHH